MYKFVVIDLDGTMLNSYGLVTKKTKKTIKKVINKGIEVVIASGRPISSIKTVAKEIGSKNYIIAGNGALVYDIKNNKPIYEKYMPKQKVLEIIKMCEENNIFYNVYTDTVILANSLKYNILYYHKQNLKKEKGMQTNISIVENVYEYVKNAEEIKFLKITVCEPEEKKFRSILKQLKEIKDIDLLNFSCTSKKIIKEENKETIIEYFYTDISTKNVNKWNAVEFLINKLKIKKEEVIAIGDNDNDKKMIENSGLGIVMGSGIPSVREKADYVTEGNDNEGVAIALEKFI